MLPYEPFGQWPPEVPPYRPPGPPVPAPAPAPVPTPVPAPRPVLPTWEEYEPSAPRDVIDRLLDQRIVLVSGALDDDLANQTISRLLVLGHSRAPVELHLTCDRSDLGASLTLADAVDMIRPPVKALVRGVLRGPAVAVLCACEHRAAHRNALFVLALPPTRVPAADGTEVVRLAEQLTVQEAQLRARITAVTGRADEEVAADLSAGRILSATEARDYGLLHEVV